MWLRCGGDGFNLAAVVWRLPAVWRLRCGGCDGGGEAAAWWLRCGSDGFGVMK